MYFNLSKKTEERKPLGATNCTPNARLTPFLISPWFKKKKEMTKHKDRLNSEIRWPQHFPKTCDATPAPRYIMHCTDLSIAFSLNPSYSYILYILYILDIIYYIKYIYIYILYLLYLYIYINIYETGAAVAASCALSRHREMWKRQLQVETSNNLLKSNKIKPNWIRQINWKQLFFSKRPSVV